MRELCPNCYGIGTMRAENWHYTDINGRQILGDVACYNCRGRGFKDWHSVEAQKFELQRNQRMLRAAVDLGGSVYSKESRFFKVEEVRWGAISSVYFQPKKVCELLGLVFPGDLEDTEAAVKHASWDPNNGWRVTPKTDDRSHHSLCQALQLQLNQQLRIEESPQFQPERLPYDATVIAPISTFKLDLIHLQKGKLGRSWRDAVAAVKAERADAQAA